MYAERSAKTTQSDATKRSGDPNAPSLAFGLERIGLISLQRPWIVAIVAIGLMVMAAFGVARIKVDDSLSQLFRADTPEFRRYEEVARRFPSSEFDVLLVVEGRDLLARDSLEKLREVVTDLQLIEGVRGLISIYSARQPPDNDQVPAALFPDPLPEGILPQPYRSRPEQ